MSTMVCIYASDTHLTIPTKTQLTQIACAAFQSGMLYSLGWPDLIVSAYTEGFFVTVPDDEAAIEESKMPYDLKKAMLLARNLNVGLLRFDRDGAFLRQLQRFDDH